jgi:hypothetical protein
MIGLAGVGRSSRDEIKRRLLSLLVDVRIAYDTREPMDCTLVTLFYLKCFGLFLVSFFVYKGAARVQ